jgi:hypothetical protein
VLGRAKLQKHNADNRIMSLIHSKVESWSRY